MYVYMKCNKKRLVCNSNKVLQRGGGGGGRRRRRRGKEEEEGEGKEVGRGDKGYLAY